MKLQGASVAALAEQLGVDHSTIVDWRGGRRLPRIHLASALADALYAPHIAEHVVAARSLECDQCARSFVYDNVGGRPRQFCSQKCARLSWAHRHRTEARREWGQVHTGLRNRAVSAVAAIGAFCRSCEWDGLCKDAECPLRDYSPLPLAKTEAA
jgi:transcriptional regulator with XRE-family HTH domain